MRLLINHNVIIFLFWCHKETPTQLAITCSKLTLETLDQGVKGVFIVNFEHISHLGLVFLLLSLSR